MAPDWDALLSTHSSPSFCRHSFSSCLNTNCDCTSSYSSPLSPIPPSAGVFFLFICVSPFLAMPHLSCSLPSVFFEQLVAALLAFFRASYSRHSWDSSRSRERRQAELLLWCQCLVHPLTVRSTPFHIKSVELDINLASFVVILPCSVCRLAKGCVSSQTGNGSCDLERTKFNKAVLMWGTQNPTTKDMLNPTGTILEF